MTRAGSRGGLGRRQTEEAGRLGDTCGREDRGLTGGRLGPLGHLTGGTREAPEMELVEFRADGPPGLAGRILGDPDEQQGEPAEQDVGPDAILSAVEDRAQSRGSSSCPARPLDLEELLVAEGDVFRGQRRVAGPEQELAVEALFASDRRPVDPQEATGADA